MMRRRAVAYYTTWVMLHLSFARGGSRACQRTAFAQAVRPVARRSIFSLGSSTEHEKCEVRAMTIEMLHEQLDSLGIQAEALQEAAIQSVQDPTSGYDTKFGKSAIKTYRAFVDPKKPSLESNASSIAVHASCARCARQVDFLVKRHKSHQTDWVRHNDTIEGLERRRTFPIMLVLDNVRSAFNVGSLFRTADACGCSNIVTTGITPHPNGSGAEKLTKSALGADKLVPSRHFRTTLEAVQTLRDELPGWKLIGMETTERSILYTDMEYPNEPEAGTILVLGNEVTGVDTEILPLLDDVVEIPMFGAKNSLNIAACAPVVLYEVLRQWKVSST